MSTTTENTSAEPGVERTLAFFSAPDTATVLLRSTVAHLITSLDIQLGVIDLSTHAGVVIASAFEDAEVPFIDLGFGQDDHHDETTAGYAQRFREMAKTTIEMPVHDLGLIDANVVLVPAAATPGEPVVDFADGTVVGAVLAQLEAAGIDFMIIDTPERGLRPTEGGAYVRGLLTVQPKT